MNYPEFLEEDPISNDKLYALNLLRDKEEFHLFEYDSPKQGMPAKSVCEKMDVQDRANTVFVDKEEEEARLGCAKIGRRMCGVCVSHLYLPLNK